MNKENYYRIRNEVYASAGKDTFDFDLMMVRVISKAVEEERDACAALCFQIWNKWMDEKDITPFPDAEDCAFAIRARGVCEHR